MAKFTQYEINNMKTHGKVKLIKEIERLDTELGKARSHAVDLEKFVKTKLEIIPLLALALYRLDPENEAFLKLDDETAEAIVEEYENSKDKFTEKVCSVTTTSCADCIFCIHGNIEPPFCGKSRHDEEFAMPVREHVENETFHPKCPLR